MAVDPKEVAKLVKDGVVFGCASCKEMHRALREGRSGCNRKDCGSPLSGGTFDKYDGPVSSSYWPNLCWVCGGESVRAFRVIASQRTFGVCDSHADVHLAGFSEDDVLILGKPAKKQPQNLIQALVDGDN